MTRTRVLLVGLLVAVLLPPGVSAQGRRAPRREIPGLDFSANGVWRARARAVRRYRAALLSQRAFSTLNAPLAAGVPQASLLAVSGVLSVPVVRFDYQNIRAPTTSPFSNADYDQVLFATVPPFGRPYTYHSFYDEMSNHLLDIEGQTFGPATLTGNEVTYTGGTSATCQASNPFKSQNCNGLFSQSAVTAMQQGLTEALRKLDATIDFTQFTFDPNTGVVSLVLFIQPALGGECGPQSNPQNHLWSHRFFLSSPYVTNDPWPGHPSQFLTVVDYILQSEVGGNGSCDASQPMPIGTVAHETGHGFGLPDLYSTDGSSEGIGEYSLMSSGNFTTGFSPSRMDAWSLNELGWVTLAPITVSNVYSFRAAPTSDTAFVVQPTGPNPRGEYFLLENRQPVQSDSAMIRIHCEVSGNPPFCGGGLLIYHVDAQQVANGTAFGNNSVQNGPIHGLELVQADGLGNLDAKPSSVASNRGDGGDPYPGIANNLRYSFGSNPSARKNADNTFVGFGVDSLEQVVTNGAMSFYLQFGNLTVVKASDTTAVVSFDGAPYFVFRDMLDSLSTHTVSIADIQFSSDTRTRYRFLSWSDGQPRRHGIVGQPQGQTITATLARDRQLVYVASNNKGHVDVSPATPSGSYVAEGTAITLTATVDAAGYLWGGWLGDTLSRNTQITLPMNRPYAVRAVFLQPLATADVVAQLLGVATPLNADQLGYLDVFGNTNRRFDVGDFKAWVDATGAPP